MASKKKPQSNTKEKRKSTIGTVLIIALFAGVLGLNPLLKATLKTETPIVVVTSGSMVPNINIGDICLIGNNRDPEDIKNGTIEDLQGDVILFDTHGVWSSPIDNPVIHRVVGKRYDNSTDTWFFITKGDANSVVDEKGVIREVPEDKILGVFLFRIPWVGKIKLYLDENRLTVPLIVVLGVALVISIVWDITHPEDDAKKEKTKEPQN